MLRHWIHSGIGLFPSVSVTVPVVASYCAPVARENDQVETIVERTNDLVGTFIVKRTNDLVGTFIRTNAIPPSIGAVKKLYSRNDILGACRKCVERGMYSWGLVVVKGAEMLCTVEEGVANAYIRLTMPP